MRYVVAYNVGNPLQSLVIGEYSIRSGGQKVFDKLPVEKSKLVNIPGVTVSEVHESVPVKDIIVENPKYRVVEEKKKQAGSKKLVVIKHR